MEDTQQYCVHKFGGTSLANAERFTALKSILTGKNEIIVVSATHGTTNVLQTALDQAKQGKSFLPVLDELEKSHEHLAMELLSDNNQKKIISEIKNDFIEIKDILHAVQLTGTYAKEIQDRILGYGEIWSAKIVASYLSNENKVIFLDAASVLYVYDAQGIKCIEWEKSHIALKAFLKDKSFNQIVITGYVATTLEGKRTTLGRNGSDFSAAIFAKLFKAKALTIWTDVDGIYTADPQRVRSAFVIDELSYKEALELAYFGAKVLHPMAIAPVLELNIPLYIKNSFHPEAKGTAIMAVPAKSPFLIKGLTCIDDIALINIEGAGMVGVSGVAARVFQTLQQANISVILISQASSEHSICVAVLNVNASAAIAALKENLRFEMNSKQIEGISVDTECSILAVVGDEMVGKIGISGKLCDSLAKANINIRAISQGSSERNISIVIKKDDATRAMRAVHAGFYLSRKTISIGLIGPGHVGKTLLKQIHAGLETLKSRYHVNLYVRGIMNSRTMLLSHTPIDLQQWEGSFKQSNDKADIKKFTDHILADDVPHAVIIDCTANTEIAHYYIDFFKKGMHVITPNKHANAGDLNYYKKIKTVTHELNKYYLYEATVCAGLPVINTLQDIINTGDAVEKIEGIMSGTLSYIFNELAKGRVFSEVVLEAKRLGYTEPDPREDLSGMDVARKLVCLAREIGCVVRLDDVKVTNLVPQILQSCSVQEFQEKLHLYDNEIMHAVTKANSEGKKLCYAASLLADGTMRVKLEEVSSGHPFFMLKGSDNMLILHTRRYHDQPLVIQGPGAGDEVTAAGVFADLLRLVSYLA